MAHAAQEKQLFIHIGTHKTGTTSIQSFLAENGTFLAEHGVLYPAPYPKTNPGHHYVANQLGTSGLKGRRHPSVRQLLKAIESTPYHKIIVSTELFSVIEPRLVAEVFAGYECHVVCVLRRQDDYLESMYRELRKSSFFEDDVSVFLDKVFAGQLLTIFRNNETELRGRLPVDYAAFLASWAEYFGEDRIHAIAYEEAARKGGVLAAVLGSAGIPAPPLERQGKKYNKSFSAPLLQLRTAIDQGLSWDQKIRLRGVFWWANENIALDDSRYFIDGAERRAIMAREKSANASVVESYLRVSGEGGLLSNLDGAFPSVESLSLETALAICRAMLAHQADALERQGQLLAQQAEELEEFRKNATQFPIKTGATAPERQGQALAQATYEPGESRRNVTPFPVKTGATAAGICTGYFLRARNSVDLANHPDMPKRIEELNVQHHRVPFVWTRLQRMEGEKLVWDEATVKEIGEVLETLPAARQVLGVFSNPPKEVVAKYFYDQSSIGPLFASFVEGCMERFPRVTAWEVGNEPNGSDFYLSIKDGDGHRPWTPAEFVRQYFAPAARAIREKQPNAKICVGAVAENGIVGHNEKPFCISNLMPATPPFKEMRSKVPHGQFYFIPGFLFPLLDELAGLLKENRAAGQRPLFDAIALHPYPYHEIYKKTDPDLANESLKLLEEFILAAKERDLRGVECWITEVGCRSLDVPHRNFWDEEAQAVFLERFLGDKLVKDNVARVYWYQLVDTDYDLRQEKTFGLLDHNALPKKAFYSLQHIAVESRESLDAVRDDFGWGVKWGKGAVNPALWTVSSRTVFAYVLASQGADGRAEIALCPGRAIGDWIELASRKPFRAVDGFCEVAFDYRLKLAGDQYALQVILRPDGVAADAGVVIEIANEADGPVAVGFAGSGEMRDVGIRPAATADMLEAVRVQVSPDGMVVQLRFGAEWVEKPLRCAFGEQVQLMHVALRLIQKRNRSGIATLANFVARQGARRVHELGLKMSGQLPESTEISYAVGLKGRYDMKIDELVKRARMSAPELKKMQDERAVALVEAVFKIISGQIAETEEGAVNIAGLGRFRVRQVEREEDGKKVTRKNIVFQRADGAKKAGAKGGKKKEGKAT